MSPTDCERCRGHRVQVRLEGFGLSCSAMTRTLIQITFASFFSLSTSSATDSTMHACFALGGLLDLQGREAGRDIDSQIAGVISSMGFFFAFMMFGSEA